MELRRIKDDFKGGSALYTETRPLGPLSYYLHNRCNYLLEPTHFDTKR